MACRVLLAIWIFYHGFLLKFTEASFHQARSFCGHTALFESSSICNTNSAQWIDAINLLESTVLERKRFDHRSQKAHLVGLYSDEAVDLVIAVQPDRSRGRKFIFLDNAKDGRVIGYMLTETRDNSGSGNTERNEAGSRAQTLPSSMLRGMCIDKASRGLGYSGIFLAIWLRLCLETDVVPSTCRIKKPLLALTLIRFGFTPLLTPTSNDRVDVVRIAPQRDSNVVMLSSKTSSPNRLEAGFTKTERKSQGIVFQDGEELDRACTTADDKEVYIRTQYQFCAGVGGLEEATAILGSRLQLDSTMPLSSAARKNVLRSLCGPI